MTITPIHAVQFMAKNNAIDAIEGVIAKVYPDVSKGTHAEYGDWTIQKGTFRGSDGNDISVKFCDMPLVGADWCNIPVRISNGPGDKAKSLKVDEYNGKKSLKIAASAVFTWNPPDMAAPAPVNAPPQQRAPQGPSGPPQHQQGTPPAQGPPAQRQPQQSAPQQHSAPPQTQAKPTIFGATVGMAIKLAGDLMLADRLEWPAPGTPAFSTCLYEIASDIVRISQRMESGTLAKSPSIRAERGARPSLAPTARPDIEPDYSQAPPPNSRESGQADTYHPDGPHHSARPPAFPSGGNTPNDDDEIPF